jgi:hypothetical protein
MWTKVPTNDLDKAREMRDAGFVRLVFRADGYWAEEIPRDPDPELEEFRQKVAMAQSFVEASKGPLGRTGDGKYVTNYQRCPCGEQYLIGAQHEKYSERHKQWLRNEIEVPVPEQPLIGAFERHGKPPPLEFGLTLICPRCKARNRKGMDELDYFMDPRSTTANPFRCRRCNGHGLVPNAGPQ